MKWISELQIFIFIYKNKINVLIICTPLYVDLLNKILVFESITSFEARQECLLLYKSELLTRLFQESTNIRIIYYDSL